MHARDAVLEAPHVNESMGKIDLVPSQRAQLGDAQAMPEAYEDHGCIAQAVTASTLLGGRYQAFYFLGRQVFARSNIAVEAARGRHCPI